MAEVWLGEGDAVDVAIKLMPHVAKHQTHFEAEAAVLARLVHPRIIRILDFGQVELSIGDVPFLALELAEGPSLKQWLETTPVGWNDVLAVGRRLLEALAHAHARGLVHRDIKPANVLAMDVRGTDWRLTDFGIAQTALARDESNPSGTPPYMAPEQFLGRARDQGPWTDLYSFGCVFYEMLVGLPPFNAAEPMRLAFQHLSEPPPQLVARMEVPDGTAEFIAVLLRKDPLARFRHAADALRALQELPSLHASRSIAASPVGEGADTYVTPPFEPTLILGDLAEFDWKPRTEEEAPVVEPLPPPAEPPTTSPRYYFQTFHGDTEPGIADLRELPFVGRLDERRELWRALRRVASNRRRETVLITGPQGLGKTAIGRWLGHTVEEYRFAVAVSIEGDDVESACIAALTAMYRLAGLDVEGAAARILRWATPPAWAVETVARAVASGEVGDVDVVSATLAVLWAHAERGPLVLFIDDADRSAAWIAFVRRASTLGFADVPVLVVAASRIEILSDLGLNTVALGPFAAGECSRLVSELLGLAPRHAFAIAEAVEGNPQYAVDVVKAWVDAGHMVRVAEKWTLRGGKLPPLPESVGAVRAQQYEAIVSAHSDDRAAMEALAVFDGPCTVQDWAKLCALAGLEPSLDLTSRCVRSGVLTVEGEWLRFADSILRKRAVESAERNGSKASFHRAIVRLMKGAAGKYPDALVGAHLFDAGLYEEAVPLLFGALKGRSGGSANALLERFEEAVRQLGAADSELDWWGRLERLRVDVHDWKGDRVRQEICLVIDQAAVGDWTELECDACVFYAKIVSARAPTGVDAAIAARGVALSDGLEDVLRRAEARTSAGAMYGYLGRLDDAMECYEQAHELALSIGDLVAEGEAGYGIGWVHFLRGDLDRALPPLHEAIERMQRAGKVWSAHAVRCFTGDVYRALGQLDAADAAFTEAYHYYSRYHVLDPILPLNFAMLEVARGRIDDALRWARRAVRREGARQRHMVVALACCIELLAAAGDNDTTAWDRWFSEMRELNVGENAAYDVAYVADLAARESVSRMDEERAHSLVAQAVVLWERLGRESEAGALRTLL